MLRAHGGVLGESWARLLGFWLSIVAFRGPIGPAALVHPNLFLYCVVLVLFFGYGLFLFTALVSRDPGSCGVEVGIGLYMASLEAAAVWHSLLYAFCCMLL